MSWDFELRSEVRLISPQNNFHYAKWRANDRSFEKKLGIFEPPNFKGSIVQDLNVKSTLYPMTLYFDGTNHHKDADDFYDSCRDEIGQWEVTHPVRGALILQLISYTEIMDPVNNGSYTEIETSWIEPANADRLVGLDSLLEAMLLSAAAFILDGIATLKQLRADAYASIAAVSGALNKIANLSDSILKQITATDALAQESWNSLRASFNNAIDNFGIDDPDPTAASEALAEMLQEPAKTVSDFGNTFSTYESSIDAVSALAPDGITDQDYNTALSLEYGICTNLAGIIQLIASTTFMSRTEVVAAMDNMTNLFTSVLSTFDNIQEAFSESDIDKQFYSFSQDYSALTNMFGLAMQYLISQFYNLKVEKRFTLKKQRSPLEITITEYGDIGEDDANYDLFISSNHLSGNDILILPAGREVVIYE